MRWISGLAAVGIAALVAFWSWSGNDPDPAARDGAPIVTVTVPELGAETVIGQRVFDAKCAACHGTHAAGRNGMGPPLIHKIYEPSHHGDMAIFLAAQSGVRAHHWPFGDMPPVEGITRAEVASIVTYIRALQRANGIE